MPSTMVHVRVDEKVKEEASATLARMGISVSDAVRMMLVRIAAERRSPLKYVFRMQPRSRRCKPLIRSKANGSALRRHYSRS
jgi:addiction module RelB/DinJ family antitoxin